MTSKLAVGQSMVSLLAQTASVEACQADIDALRSILHCILHQCESQVIWHVSDSLPGYQSIEYTHLCALE